MKGRKGWVSVPCEICDIETREVVQSFSSLKEAAEFLGVTKNATSKASRKGGICKDYFVVRI